MCVFHIRYLATRLGRNGSSALGNVKNKSLFYFSARGFVMCYRFLGRRKRSANWRQTSSSSSISSSSSSSCTYVHKRFMCHPCRGVEGGWTSMMRNWQMLRHKPPGSISIEPSVNYNELQCMCVCVYSGSSSSSSLYYYRFSIGGGGRVTSSQSTWSDTPIFLLFRRQTKTGESRNHSTGFGIHRFVRCHPG